MLEIAEPRAAEFLLDGDAVQAEIAQLRPEIAREEVAAVDLVGARRDLVGAKAATVSRSRSAVSPRSKFSSAREFRPMIAGMFSPFMAGAVLSQSSKNSLPVFAARWKNHALPGSGRAETEMGFATMVNSLISPLAALLDRRGRHRYGERAPLGPDRGARDGAGQAAPTGSAGARHSVRANLFQRQKGRRTPEVGREPAGPRRQGARRTGDRNCS